MPRAFVTSASPAAAVAGAAADVDGGAGLPAGVCGVRLLLQPTIAKPVATMTPVQSLWCEDIVGEFYQPIARLAWALCRAT